jgi:hypothetical protein
MIDYAIAFGLGLLWMFLVSVQTILLTKNNSDLILFGWVVITSVIWGYVVKTISITPDLITPYAIGTGIGMVSGRKLLKRLEKK